MGRDQLGRRRDQGRWPPSLRLVFHAWDTTFQRGWGLLQLAWEGQNIPLARIVVLGRVVELGSPGGTVVAAAGIDRTGRADSVGEVGRCVDRGRVVAEGIVRVVDTEVESGMVVGMVVGVVVGTVVGVVVARLHKVADLEKIQGLLPSLLSAWPHSQPEEEDKFEMYSTHPVP
jgi:hypothetical protein